jgi:O-antigen/teichoic acid export membrane protein
VIRRHRPKEPHKDIFATDHLQNGLRKRTVSGGAVTALAQGGVFILTLGATMILARLLRPHDFGLVAMVTTITGFLRIFSDAGLSTATIQREGITQAQVSNLFWTNLCVSGFATILTAAVAPIIAWFYGEPSLVGITLALSITFLLSGTAAQHLALLNRQMRFGAIAVIQMGSTGAGVVTGLVLAWMEFGYWSLIGAQLSVPLTGLVLTWSASQWRPQWPTWGSGTRPLLTFGANVTASAFIYSLARGLDGLIVGKWYGSVALGFYSRAAALLVRPVDQFTGPISAVLVPALSRLQSDPTRYRRTFLQAYEGVVLIGFLSAGFVVSWAHPLTLVVLGPKWEEAAVIVAAFAFASVFLPLCSAASWLFASQGRGEDWLRASVAVSVLTVISFVAGLPFGPSGVAISFSGFGVLIVLPTVYYIAGRSGPVKMVDLAAGFFRHVPVMPVVLTANLVTRALLRDFAPLTQLSVGIPVGLAAAVAVVYAWQPARATIVALRRAFGDLRSISV